MSRLKAQFKYASLKESNSKDILDRRNDELTRQMSHTTDLVEWDGHSGWFASSLTNPNRLLVMCVKMKIQMKKSQ